MIRRILLDDGPTGSDPVQPVARLRPPAPVNPSAPIDVKVSWLPSMNAFAFGTTQGKRAHAFLISGRIVGDGPQASRVGHFLVEARRQMRPEVEAGVMTPDEVREIMSALRDYLAAQGL